MNRNFILKGLLVLSMFFIVVCGYFFFKGEVQINNMKKLSQRSYQMAEKNKDIQIKSFVNLSSDEESNERPTEQQISDAIKNISKVQEQLVGTIQISAINLNLAILIGSSYNNMLYGACTTENNDIQNLETGRGNLTLSSHNTGTQNMLFTSIVNIPYGSEITVRNYEGKSFKYSVDKKYKIEADKKEEVVRENSDNILTLITCDIPYKTQYRDIVVASRVE
ncbi:sortase [Floricoccus penangensis]|uniref:sortase n=1 Tax=Floricoccus penangensis TaxID=1859475 RepID=UPI00203B1C30|nr:sortase [Floricoccus penangensis]URZ87268.1 sortase [Floricoccus penangensis]